MSWDAKDITLGLRHQKLFGTLGRMGDILDAVLRLKSRPPFPPNSFNSVTWANPVTAQLGSGDDALTVKFSVDGIILRADVEEDEGLRQSSVVEMFLRVLEVALPVSGGGSVVDRIGVVEKYHVPHPTPARAASDTLLRLQMPNYDARDFAMRVAFRSPTEHGLHTAGVEDWRNVILQVEADKEDETSDVPDRLTVTMDVQHYFVPSRQYDPNDVRAHVEYFNQQARRFQEERLRGLVPEQVTA